MSKASAPNPDVDPYFANAKSWREEVLALRTIMLASGMQEELKWRQPVYTLDGHNVCMIARFKNHCVVGFFKGALLKDEQLVLRQPGADTQSSRFLPMTSMADVKRLKPIIKAYVQEAMANEKAGLKVTFKKITERTIPEELAQFFKKRPSLKKAFEALTPGRQRAYLIHFSSAKQSATRIARIERCIPRIMAGKGMDD